MTNERFYIEEEFESGSGVGSPTIKDRETDETVCEDIYDTLALLNELTKESILFELDALQLIKVKEQVHTKLESKYFELVTRENDLKNVENSLWLKTDFKSQGLTNDKMRTAFVSDNSSDIRFKIAMAKYELKQLENHIKIINDLIILRMQGGE